MIKEIKEIYGQLQHKSQFVDMVSYKFHKSPGTIRNHWLYGNAMPVEHQKEFRKLALKALKNQQKLLNSLKS